MTWLALQVAGPPGQVLLLEAQPPPAQQVASGGLQLEPSGQQLPPAGRQASPQHLPLAQGVEPQQRPSATHCPPQQSVPGEQQPPPHGSCPMGQAGGSGAGSSGLAAQYSPTKMAQVPSKQQ